MNGDDPIELLFGGMKQLGPGSDAETKHVLGLLPGKEFEVVVDAGCGTGRQTLVLAKELGVPVHAIDNYEPFLNDLNRYAKEAGVEQLVQTHCADMKDIPNLFPDIDLLWSEGAAYSIGFAKALASWASVIRQGGFLVVSEISWMKEEIPTAVRNFFQREYPDMKSVEQNIETAERAGYKLLTTYTVAKESWERGYYDVLEPRANTLKNHHDPSVRELAREMLEEIDVFRHAEDSYGYLFCVLQRI